MASTRPLPIRPESAARWPADRVLVAGSLVLLMLAAWAYLIYEWWAMAHMDIVDMAMPAGGAWGAADLLLVFTMWAIMMVGMMVPSASPMVLLFARIDHERRGQQRGFVATWAFLLGYLAVWTVFSLAATLAQWALHGAALISPMMESASPLLGGVLLMTAGVYQFSRLKNACLARCRSPLQFLLIEWREGGRGAFVMGVRHGAFCTGCCWALMALLFVLGVMNLYWIMALSAFVLAEKIVPHGEWVTRISGLLLIAWGVWMVVP